MQRTLHGTRGSEYPFGATVCRVSTSAPGDETAQSGVLSSDTGPQFSNKGFEKADPFGGLVNRDNHPSKSNSSLWLSRIND